MDEEGDNDEDDDDDEYYPMLPKRQFRPCRPETMNPDGSTTPEEAECIQSKLNMLS